MTTPPPDDTREAWPWRDLDHPTAAALLADHLERRGGGRLEPLGRGDFCLAFRLGDRVVRVARHAEAAEALRREACVLAAVADELPLPVPRPAHHRPEGCPPFSVHEGVVGAVLTRDAWLGMPADGRDRAAAELAEFVVALHALDPAAGADCGLPRLDAGETARRLRGTASEALRPLLDRETLRRLDAALERWSSPVGGEPRPPSLLHRDLAPGHLLYDPATGRLTGVIDFGDAALGEPARDLVYLYEDFGPELLADVLRHHPRGWEPSLLAAIRRWYVLEAVDWTLERVAAGRTAPARHGLAGIRRELLDIGGG